MVILRAGNSEVSWRAVGPACRDFAARRDLSARNQPESACHFPHHVAQVRLAAKVLSGGKDLQNAVLSGRKDLQNAVLSGRKDLQNAVLSGRKDLL